MEMAILHSKYHHKIEFYLNKMDWTTIRQQLNEYILTNPENRSLYVVNPKNKIYIFQGEDKHKWYAVIRHEICPDLFWGMNVGIQCSQYTYINKSVVEYDKYFVMPIN